MNPLTNVKNINKLNEIELAKGTVDKKSWHDMYKDSAWIFIGGLAYGLTEGDILTVFSQYGEIVNINLIRDKKTGKIKGFCFLCYANQKSTILAVDNFNGIKLCGRTIRVDHVANYKPPKENEQDDEVTKMLKSEGCAPKPIKQEPSDNVDKKHKRKKSKKEKKHKKKRNGNESKTDFPIKKDKEKHDSAYTCDNLSIKTEFINQDQRSVKEIYTKDVKRSHKLQQTIRSDDDNLNTSSIKSKHTGMSANRDSDHEFSSNVESENHRHSSQEKKSMSRDRCHNSKKSQFIKNLDKRNAFRLSSKEISETHNSYKKRKKSKEYDNKITSSTDSDCESKNKYSQKKGRKKHKRCDSLCSRESSQDRQSKYIDLRDSRSMQCLDDKKINKSPEMKKHSGNNFKRQDRYLQDCNKHCDIEEKTQDLTAEKINKNDTHRWNDEYKSVSKRTSRKDDCEQYNYSMHRNKHADHKEKDRDVHHN